MRYGLAFPGSLLTALAFLATRRQPEIQALHAPRVSRGLLGLAILFAVYAVAAGLIVKLAPFFPATVFNYDSFMRVTGVPVQVLRAACAIGMAIAICQVLDIFELEALNRMNLAYREILQISNSERARIGQDLHDGLGQEMTGIAYMAKALEAGLATRAPDAAEEVRRLRAMLDACIDTVRTLSRGLYPVAIEKNGLVFALQEFVAGAEQLYRIACTLEADEALTIDDHATAVHLFRIAQEAVANAIKHGQASELKIRLVRQAGRLMLSIEDDGRGIPDPAERNEGMGLRIMRYRAGVIGADLEVLRRPQGGTMVRCQLHQSRPPLAG
jgi:signal transduction histidine kinase